MICSHYVSLKFHINNRCVFWDVNCQPDLGPLPWEVTLLEAERTGQQWEAALYLRAPCGAVCLCHQALCHLLGKLIITQAFSKCAQVRHLNAHKLMVIYLCTRWKMNFIFQLRYYRWRGKFWVLVKILKPWKGVDVIKWKEGKQVTGLYLSQVCCWERVDNWLWSPQIVNINKQYIYCINPMLRLLPVLTFLILTATVWGWYYYVLLTNEETDTLERLNNLPRSPRKGRLGLSPISFQSSSRSNSRMLQTL